MKQALAAFFVLCVAGCATDPASPGQTNAIFPDLPSPQGFAYVNGYGYTQTAFRNYIQTFKGKARLDGMVAWYKEAFKAHDWNLSNETSTDHASLTFLKKAEQVLVVMTDAADGMTIVVKVTKRD